MDLDFTGEYCVPGKTPNTIEDEHIERYKFARPLVDGKVVLDIACGVGYGSKLMAESGALKVDAVDISKEVVSYASKTYQKQNLNFYEGDIRNFVENGPYDVITCFETIEHVSDFHSALINLFILFMKCDLTPK